MKCKRGVSLTALIATAVAAAPATAMAQSSNPVRTGVYRGAVTPLVRGATSQNAIGFAVSGTRLTQFALKYHLSCADNLDRTLTITLVPSGLRPLTSRSRGFGIQQFDNQTFTGDTPADTIVGGLIVDGNFSSAPTRSNPRRTKITGKVVLWGRTAAGVLCTALAAPGEAFAEYTAYWSGPTPNITRR